MACHLDSQRLEPLRSGDVVERLPDVVEDRDVVLRGQVRERDLAAGIGGDRELVPTGLTRRRDVADRRPGPRRDVDPLRFRPRRVVGQDRDAVRNAPEAGT